MCFFSLSFFFKPSIRRRETLTPEKKKKNQLGVQKPEGADSSFHAAHFISFSPKTIFFSAEVCKSDWLTVIFFFNYTPRLNHCTTAFIQSEEWIQTYQYVCLPLTSLLSTTRRLLLWGPREDCRRCWAVLSKMERLMCDCCLSGCSGWCSEVTVTSLMNTRTWSCTLYCIRLVNTHRLSTWCSGFYDLFLTVKPPFNLTFTPVVNS